MSTCGKINRITYGFSFCNITIDKVKGKLIWIQISFNLRMKLQTALWPNWNPWIGSIVICIKVMKKGTLNMLLAPNNYHILHDLPNYIQQAIGLCGLLMAQVTLAYYKVRQKEVLFFRTKAKTWGHLRVKLDGKYMHNHLLQHHLHCPERLSTVTNTHLWWTARCSQKTAQRWSPSSSSPRRYWGWIRRNYWPPGLSSGTARVAPPTDNHFPGGTVSWRPSAPGAGGLHMAAPPMKTQ